MFTNFCILVLYTVQTKCKIVQFGIKKKLVFQQNNVPLPAFTETVCWLANKGFSKEKNNVKKVLGKSK